MNFKKKAYLYCKNQNNSQLDHIYIQNILTTPWYEDRYKKRSLNRYLNAEVKTRYFISTPILFSNQRLNWLCQTKQAAVECIFISTSNNWDVDVYQNEQRKIERFVGHEKRKTVRRCMMVKIKEADMSQ